MKKQILVSISILLIINIAKSQNQLFQYNAHANTRWSSPENLNGEKGKGGKTNSGAKGHAFDSIPAGRSLSLLDIQDQGVINRIWITISDRSPQMLRSLKLEMFWDDEKKPAVSVPFGDFFCMGLGKMSTFQNILFSTGEGRSFNSFIQMPFKKAARIVVTNESKVSLPYIFFDIDYSLIDKWDESNLYFHAFWQRDTATTLVKDFEILPSLQGKGRFLGTNIGVNGNPLYKSSWFGEGEVKVYLDGDKDYPTLNGTGTEDYLGTAWGQGKFINTYTGCTIADDSLLQWAFYRFHIVDPVYFHSSCRVVIQQMGGDGTAAVAAYQRSGAPLIPVTVVGAENKTQNLYKKGGAITKIDTATTSIGWVNFYRQDDFTATSYFYYDKPSSDLPAIQPVGIRTYNLKNKK